MLLLCPWYSFSPFLKTSCISVRLVPNSKIFPPSLARIFRVKYSCRQLVRIATATFSPKLTDAVVLFPSHFLGGQYIGDGGTAPGLGHAKGGAVGIEKMQGSHEAEHLTRPLK